jgi:hypothetical protein
MVAHELTSTNRQGNDAVQRAGEPAINEVLLAQLDRLA